MKYAQILIESAPLPVLLSLSPAGKIIHSNGYFHVESWSVHSLHKIHAALPENSINVVNLPQNSYIFNSLDLCLFRCLLLMAIQLLICFQFWESDDIHREETRLGRRSLALHVLAFLDVAEVGCVSSTQGGLSMETCRLMPLWGWCIWSLCLGSWGCRVHFLLRNQMWSGENGQRLPNLQVLCFRAIL